MKKPPGIFSLLATAVVGFGSHLVQLCSSARAGLLGRRPAPGPARRR